MNPFAPLPEPTLFLVSGEVRVSYYMSSDKAESFTHLVQARDTQHAVRAVEAHYRAQTSEYSVYYSVWRANASPLIVADDALLEGDLPEDE